MNTVETQATICEWAAATFGPPANLFRALARSNQEMAELVKVASIGGDAARIVEEAADVFITLCQVAPFVGEDLTEIMRLTVPATEPAPVIVARANGLLGHVILEYAEGSRIGTGIYISLVAVRLASICARLGVPLCLAVDAKMSVNRGRTWQIDDAGFSYHAEQRVG